jgi:hypothetical protein
MIRVTLNYESRNTEASYPGREPGSVKRYDMELSTSEEHLLTHERYGLLTTDEREALSMLIDHVRVDEDGESNVDKVTSDDGKEALAKIRRGVSHFLNPGLVWTERFSTGEIGDVDLTNLGRISDPPGNPPDDSVHTWLYIGASARNSEDGKTWEVERRWLLSGVGGWDEDLYGGEEDV